MPQRADDRSSTRDRSIGTSGKDQVNDPWDERDDDHYLSDDDGTDGALSDDAPLLSRAPSFLDHSAAADSASAGASAERPYSDRDRRGEQRRAPTSHIKMQRMNSQTGSREEYRDTDHIMPGSKHHNGGGGDKSSPGDEDEVGYKGYGGTNDLRTSSDGKRKGEEEDDPSSEPRTEVRAVDQEDYEEGDMSLDDLFDASRTAAENKSVLISHELDRMGFGRYQILLWTLCGFGYFIDLLWAQALGLIITPVLNEFAAGNAQSGLLSTAFSVGLTIGAFMWGFLVDVIGRKWSFYCTCLIASIFGIASGGANSYAALCVLMAFVGIGVGGNIPIDATITLEFLPTVSTLLLALCVLSKGNSRPCNLLMSTLSHPRAPETALPASAPRRLPAAGRAGLQRDRVRLHPALLVQPLAQQRRDDRRAGHLHARREHGLALHALHPRRHHARHLLRALRRLQVPRIALLPALARARARRAPRRRADRRLQPRPPPAQVLPRRL